MEAPNLNERSTLSMRSTASVWTDANDTWSQQPLSKADLAEELRYEEEASILADKAHASKLSRRRRCISNVNMRTMRGRVPPKPTRYWNPTVYRADDAIVWEHPEYLLRNTSGTSWS